MGFGTVACSHTVPIKGIQVLNGSHHDILIRLARKIIRLPCLSCDMTILAMASETGPEAEPTSETAYVSQATARTGNESREGGIRL